MSLCSASRPLMSQMIKRACWMTWACVLVLSACGGQTIEPVRGGPDGGGAGGSNDGGGGTAGTTAGTGGSSGAGGAGGTGGVNEKNPLTSEILEICGVLSGTSCSAGLCVTSLLHKQGQAILYGCTDHLQDFLACSKKNPWLCKPYPDAPAVEYNPACQAQNDVLLACLPDCSATFGETSCSFSCKGNIPWSVSCQQADGGLNCLCTSGPKTGLEFSYGGGCHGGLDFQIGTESVCVGAVAW